MDKIRPLTALLTDFGNDDWYVASMKGVIKSINPDAEIVDITHNIKSHSISDGAFVLYNTYSYYPEKTIFVAVVDPGVGSSRKIILLKTTKHFFIAPDNGLLTYIVKDNPKYEAIGIENKKYFLPDVSSTFHGRDIFSPVAAHLSKDYKIEKFGKKIRRLTMLYIEDAKIEKNAITAPIIYIDKFGNLIINIKKNEFSKVLKLKEIKNKTGKEILACQTPLKSSYADVDEGEVVAYWGSSEFLEIGINQASAAKRFSLKVGDVIKLKI